MNGVKSSSMNNVKSSAQPPDGRPQVDVETTQAPTVSALSSPLKRQHEIVSTIWPDPATHAFAQYKDFFDTYLTIKNTGLPNYVKAKIQVDSGLNLDAWDQALMEYHDREICRYLRYGWPVGYHKLTPPTTTVANHQSAIAHHKHVTTFIDKELVFWAVLGPFAQEPFTPWTRTSPVMISYDSCGSHLPRWGRGQRWHQHQRLFRKGCYLYTTMTSFRSWKVSGEGPTCGKLTWL